MLWLVVYEDCKQPECCNNVSERLAGMPLSSVGASAQLCMCVLGCRALARRHPWTVSLSLAVVGGGWTSGISD